MGKNSLLCLILGGAAACQSDAEPTPLSGSQPECLYVDEGFGPEGSVPIRAERVVAGLEVPWGLAFLPDGGLLVTERAGRVRMVRQGQLVAEPVLTLPVSQVAESGLLGIALHPAFPSNRWFYLMYTVRKEERSVSRVERFRLTDDGRSASPERIVIDDIPSAQFHAGGRLRFGPDGMLHVGTGDAREPDSSQRAESLAGKILRLTPEGGVPDDNPSSGSPAFVSGVRNIEGFDWLDPSTLVIADHGPSGELGRSGGDEVTLATAGSNLGWPTIWGCEQRQGMTPPALAWKEAVPPGGAAIYTGDSIPEWKGSFIIGTLGSRHLHRVVLEGTSRRVASHEVYLEGELGRLREVTMGPDGHLYVTTSNCDGRGDCPAEKDEVLRILPR